VTRSKGVPTHTTYIDQQGPVTRASRRATQPPVCVPHVTAMLCVVWFATATHHACHRHSPRCLLPVVAFQLSIRVYATHALSILRFPMLNIRNQSTLDTFVFFFQSTHINPCLSVGRTDPTSPSALKLSPSTPVMSSLPQKGPSESCGTLAPRPKPA
jgi:hypothetical protein